MDMKMLIRGSKLLVGHVHILSTSILLGSSEWSV